MPAANWVPAEQQSCPLPCPGTFHPSKIPALSWDLLLIQHSCSGTLLLFLLQAIYKMVGTVIMMRMNQDGLTPQQRVDKIFTKMDKDKDDQISLEEFKEAAKSDPSIVLLLQCDMQK